MRSEITAAANWWSVKLHDSAPHFSAEKVELFNVSLKIAMFRKFGAHWYEEEPLKGQALRSLMVSRAFVDPLVLEAAEKAKIGSIGNLLHNVCGPVTMWVDPRTVEIRMDGNASQKTHSTVIYRGYVEAPLPPVQPLQQRSINRASTLFVPSKEQQLQQLRMHGRLPESFVSAEQHQHQHQQQLQFREYLPASAYTSQQMVREEHLVGQQENIYARNQMPIQPQYQEKYARSTRGPMSAAAPSFEPRSLRFPMDSFSCSAEYLQQTRPFHVNRPVPAYR